MKVKKAPAEREVPTVRRSGRLTAINSVVRRASQFAPWIVTAWLVAMTAWYLKTAVQTIRHPINIGNEIQLAILWLILVAAVVLSHFLFRRRIVTFIWA